MISCIMATKGFSLTGDNTMVTRREAILISLAGYLSRLSIARAVPVAGFSDKQYANAMVIDALGSPGGFDPSESDDAPLSARFIADVQASGVTAVNITVNEVGNAPGRFEKTIAGIARVEHELTAHPDNAPRRFRTLADDLAHRGWTSARIEKILCRNFARLFADVWTS
jgi:hypothetical protein